MEMEYEDIDELLSDIDDCPEDICLFEAIRCLAREIGAIRRYQQFLHDSIPMKYKKDYPKEGENPFFYTALGKSTQQDSDKEIQRMGIRKRGKNEK
jgi:hypothetical protein